MTCVANVLNAVHDHVLISSYCKIKIHIMCDTVLFTLNTPDKMNYLNRGNIINFEGSNCAKYLYNSVIVGSLLPGSTSKYNLVRVSEHKWRVTSMPKNGGTEVKN